MAPDAPPPTYNAGGRPLGDWVVSAHYDSVRDDLVVSWNSSATSWRRSARGDRHYTGDEIEETLEEIHRHVVRLAVRRLF